jgi:hypothetical protein
MRILVIEPALWAAISADAHLRRTRRHVLVRRAAPNNSPARD